MACVGNATYYTLVYLWKWVLSRNEAEFESPSWHQEELSAADDRVKAGKEEFVDWDSAKRQLRKQSE